MSMWRTSMAAPRQQREFTGVPWASALGLDVPSRSGVGTHGAVTITETKAMTHSAVWACLRLRADLISTFPANVLRDIQLVADDPAIPMEMPKPPIMVDPGGLKWDFIDWMWASQRDLDMVGNCIGLIRERNGIKTRYYPEGLPSLIELQDTRGCSVISYKGKVKYRIDGKIYEDSQVYHERQNPLSGSPVGIAPIVCAAATIGESLSMQQYGLDWFVGGGIPKAWMRNTRKGLQDNERDTAKQWYDETVKNGDLMVTGKDWEYNMIQAEQAGMEWLEGRRFGVAEICRFFGVPPEMIHGAISGQSITYANVTQANLQFLIMNLGPAVKRRERSLTNLLPEPRYVKLNTDALLRLDPKTREELIRSRLESWTITNTEARGLYDLPPLNPADMLEMQDIYGGPKIGGGGAAPAFGQDPAAADGAPTGDGAPADAPVPA